MQGKERSVIVMLEISLKTDINNIAFLEYMTEHEQKKVNVNQNSFSKVSRPRKAKSEIQERRILEHTPTSLVKSVFGQFS